MHNLIGTYQVVRQLPSEECPGWQCYEVTDKATGAPYTAQLRTAADFSPSVATERLRVLRLLRELNVPGIIRIVEVGCLPEGTQYFIRELHPGRSMVEVLGTQGEPLAPDFVRKLARQLAETLARLHQHGLFGVGLCMERIWVTDDQRALLAVCETTNSVGSAGCPPIRTVVDAPIPTLSASVFYMAPEQCGVIEGSSLSNRVDVYALGAVLYHALAGRPPFPGQWTRDVFEGHLAKTPRPLLRLQPSVPEPTAQLVHRMLAKAPAQRPDIGEVARELALQLGEAVPLPPSPVDAMKTMPLPPKAVAAPRSLNRLQVGDTIDRFKLVRLLGSGGFADVFEAVDTNLGSGQRVAIKALRPEYAHNKLLLTRFFDELRATHLIRDPGIVHIYDCQVHEDGLPTITMEYLEGPTLAQELARSRRLAPLRALRIAHQVAGTMATAHARGIVHRDLKPENLILVSDTALPGFERAKVLDFGLAKIWDVAGGTMGAGTQPGSILGTPRYMAPEQRRDSSSINDRADVYALGVILFEMLEGEVPQPGPEPRAPGQREAYVPLSMLPRPASAVPDAINELLKGMLALEPASRLSMMEVTRRLTEALARGLAPSAMPRRLLLAGGVAALAGALGTTALTGRRGKRLRALLGVRWEITSDLPRAEIRDEDGMLLGYTPWSVDPQRALEKEYTSDTLNVSVFLPGYEEQLLALPIYEDVKRNLKLTPVLWRVTSEPSGACVIGPGGRELGRTPWTGRADGRRSNLRVKVVLDGYVPSVITLSFQRSEIFEVKLEAASAPAQPPSAAPHGRGGQSKSPRGSVHVPSRVPAQAQEDELPAKIYEI